MPLTEDEKSHLKNKHRGAINNAKGNLYENYYAVYQIVSCINAYFEQSCLVFFQTQLQDSFVDDLLIHLPDIKIYHQLKNTVSICWESSNKHSLASDFHRQKRICQENGESFKLKLIYSCASIDLNSSDPDNIADCTRAEFFPYCEGITDTILRCENFKTALQNISPKKELSSDDEIFNIAVVFLASWLKLKSGLTRISLADVLQNVKNINHINLNFYPSIIISEHAKRILDNIPNFNYIIMNQQLEWSFGNFSGNLIWDNNFERKLIKEKPTDAHSLLSIL